MISVRYHPYIQLLIGPRETSLASDSLELYPKLPNSIQTYVFYRKACHLKKLRRPRIECGLPSRVLEDELLHAACS